MQHISQNPTQFKKRDLGTFCPVAIYLNLMYVSYLVAFCHGHNPFIHQLHKRGIGFYSFGCYVNSRDYFYANWHGITKNSRGNGYCLKHTIPVLPIVDIKKSNVHLLDIMFPNKRLGMIIQLELCLPIVYGITRTRLFIFA